MKYILMPFATIAFALCWCLWKDFREAAIGPNLPPTSSGPGDGLDYEADVTGLLP